MADVNKTISISYRAETANLVNGLTRVGKISEVEANRIMKSLDKAYEQASKEAQKSSKSQIKSLDDVEKKSKSLSKSMMRGAAEIGGAMIAAGGAILLFGQQLADLSNQLVDASTKTGVSTDTLSGLRLAAEGAGLSFEELEAGLIRLPQLMNQAANGSKSAQRAFDNLGISITQNVEGFEQLRSADDVLKDIFHSLQDVASAEEKAALAAEIFGRQAGPKFIQSGAIENLEAFMEMANEFGVSTGPNMQKNMADFQRISAASMLVVQGQLSKMLDTFMGTEEGGGLNASVMGLAKAFLYMGSIGMDTFNALNTMAGTLMATSMGFTKLAGGALFAGGPDYFEIASEFAKEGEEDTRNFLVMFDRAEEQLKQFDAALKKTLESPVATPSRRRAAMDATAKAEQAMARKELETASALILELDERILEREKEITKEYVDQLSEQEKRNLAINEEIQSLMTEKSLIEDRVNTQIRSLETMERTAEIEQLINDLVDYREVRYGQIDDRLGSISENLSSMSMTITDDDFDAVMADFDKFAEKQQEQQEGIASMVSSLRDGAVEAAEKAQEAWNRTFTDIRTGIGMLVTGLGVAGDLVDAYSVKNRHNAELVFNLRKAAAIAEVAMQTAINITEVFPNPFLMAGAVALGTAQTAVIAAEQPQFHMGGMIGPSSGLAPDETFIRAKQGEAVLSTSVVNRIGEDGIRNLESGGTTKPIIIVTNPFKHYDRFIRGRNAMGMGSTSTGQIGY